MSQPDSFSSPSCIDSGYRINGRRKGSKYEWIIGNNYSSHGFKDVSGSSKSYKECLVDAELVICSLPRIEWCGSDEYFIDMRKRETWPEFFWDEIVPEALMNSAKERFCNDEISLLDLEDEVERILVEKSIFQM